MKIFHKIHFSKTDPLGDGLREDILDEQSESEHIELGDDNGDALVNYWQNVSNDVSNDPQWFRFEED